MLGELEATGQPTPLKGQRKTRPSAVAALCELETIHPLCRRTPGTAISGLLSISLHKRQTLCPTPGRLLLQIPISVALSQVLFCTWHTRIKSSPHLEQDMTLRHDGWASELWSISKWTQTLVPPLILLVKLLGKITFLCLNFLAGK